MSNKINNKIEIGSIVKGKVTGIQPYGAFVALNDKEFGLVHISEISHGYVRDIHEYLKVGDEVNVKILSVEGEGKYRLSIKEAEIALKRKAMNRQNQEMKNAIETSQGFNTLKDKLQEWIAQYQS